jgi:hypothetical protein
MFTDKYKNEKEKNSCSSTSGTAVAGHSDQEKKKVQLEEISNKSDYFVSR